MHLITTSSGSAVASGARIWLVPCVLFLAACALYGIHLDRLPHPDELYQILAAQGLLATGEPRIAEGLYTRAYAQTWLIAQSLALAGDNLIAARLSSVVGIAATVTLLFVWLRSVAGPAAAWTAALLFALSPFAVLTAQFARIYGVQSLAFLAGSLCLYQAASATGPLWRRAAWALVALPPLLLALHLQPTTLLGCVGLGLWLAGAVGLPWLRDPAVPARRKQLVLLGLVAAGALVLLAAVATGLLAGLWHSYRWTPLFNREQQDSFWFYHLWYTLLYPSLWPLTGLLALVAIAVHPRAGSMALLVFAVGFLLNSFAGPKSLRYIAYAQPFLFVLWGIGLVSLWPVLVRALGELAGRLEAITRPAFPWVGGLGRLLVAGALLFLAFANPAWLRTATLLAEIDLPGEAPPADWLAAKDRLQPWLAQADVVVTTEELGALYYLGRYDIRFSPSKLEEVDDSNERREFGADPRTGRPLIATPESLALAFDCYDRGLFILLSRQWGFAHLFSPAVRELILARTVPVELPRASHMMAYRWERPAGTPKPAACAGLPPLPSAAKAQPAR
jgi:hypothetical protein